MNKVDYRIIFMGTAEFSKKILQFLVNDNYNVVCVVSQPDKEVGRKKILTPSVVKQYALQHNIPVLTPNKIKQDYQDILSYRPDLIITSAYGQIIPKQLLDYPKYKCINTHASLLPKYRGPSPIQSALLNGEESTGISIMYMNEKMDEGDILYQKSINIDIKDTSTILFNKLAILTIEMLKEFLPKFFVYDIKPIKQDDNSATYTKLFDKNIEHILFNDHTLSVYNHIRALLDNPGCYFLCKGKKYKIINCFFELDDRVKPNKFIGLQDNYLRLDCLGGYIKVFTIKPEGKNEMNSKDFFNGNGRYLLGEELG